MAASNNGFSGNWKVDRSENLEAFLEKKGVGMIQRKAASHAPLTLEITQDGSQMSLKTVSPLKTIENSFKVGDEFETTSPMDGKKMKCKSSWDGDKLVLDITDEDGKQHKVTREIVGDELVQTMEAEGVVAKRFFKKK